MRGKKIDASVSENEMFVESLRPVLHLVPKRKKSGFFEV
jgi:hypothetical protein